jgi:hypothetical protein
MIRPVIPFIEYAVNKDYIAKNLCINRDKPKSCCAGKCHLKKELAKSDTSENEGKNNSKNPQQKQISEFLRTQNKHYHPIESTFVQVVLTQSRLPINAASSIFVPPKNA